MSGKRAVGLVLLGLMVLAAGISAWLLVSRGKEAAQREAALSTALAEADYGIELGYLDKAYDSLLGAMESARGEYALLRVLKRAYLIARTENRFERMQHLALRSLAAIPGSPSLRAAALYASLRCGGLEGVQRILHEDSRQGILQTLKAEASFLGERDLKIREEALPYQFRRLSDPGLQEAGNLQGLGEELGEARILLDAALLWMKKGHPVQAAQLGRERLQGPAFDEPAGFFAYDAGGNAEALKRFQRLALALPQRTDLQILCGDIACLQKDFTAAESYYRNALRREPRFSWKPFLTLAWILDQRGEREEAFRFRAEAFLVHPGEKTVALAFAQALAQRGEREKAVEILTTFLRSHADDLEANLLFLRLSGAAKAPALYQASLWGLYNRFPSSGALCRALATFLLALGDLEGAEAALGQYERAAAEAGAAWVLHLKGLAQALKGEYQAAAKSLGDSLKAKPDWQVGYNLALVLGAGSRETEAIEELGKAEALLLHDSPGPEARKLQSLIRTRLGELYLRQGSLLSARRELEYACELDGENLRPRLLLKNLEETPKK